MKRLINVRVSLIAAVTTALGIFAFYELLFGEFWFAAVAAVLLVALLAFCLVKRRGVRFAVVALVCLLLGFGRSWLYYGVHTADELFEKPLTLSGRVTDVGRNGSENSVYYVDGCTDSDGNRLRGCVRVFLYGADLSAGDVVTFYGEVSSVYPVKAEVNSFEVRHNVRYEVRNVSLVSATQGKLRLDERIRKYIYEVTQDYMPNNGGLMYALLTGDRSAVSDSDDWAFTRAGVVHLLAVSGLHVGFISSLLALALRKLKPWLQCCLTVIPLLFYAYVCAFTPSVTRAILMLVCSYAAKMLFSRYDMLTSMSWAAFITLMICPFYMFDAGFQLSFMSVFGIATLHAALCRRLRRKKLNGHLRRFVETLSVSACCIFATVFVLASQGKEIALFGVIVNIVAVPVVSIAFVLGLLGLLPWVFHWLAYISDILLQFVMSIANGVAKIGFATVFFKALSLSVIVVAALMFALGGFVDLGKLGKKIFYPICCFLLVLTVVIAYIPKRASNRAYVVQTQNGVALSVLGKSGEAAVVSDFANYSAVYDAVCHLETFLTKDVTLYVFNVSQADVDAVELALDKLEVKTAFLLDAQTNDAVTTLLSSRGAEVVRQYPNSKVGKDVCVRTLYDATLAAVCVSVGEMNFCLVTDESKTSSVVKMGLGAEFYLLQKGNETLENSGFTMLTPYQSELNHNLGANKYGNFTIKQKGDKIKISYR